jgi:hypothetical protein
MNRHRAFGAAATLAVLVALLLGFLNLGGRGRQRDLRSDEERSRDLHRIASAIKRWYAKDRKLPPDLNAISEDRPGLHVRDPVTQAAYEYKPTGDTQYELCATFAANVTNASLGPYPVSRFNSHAAGRQCFNLDAVQPIASP